MHLPPCSRILRLPFEAWCDTDLELFLALDTYDASLCTCGRATSLCRDASHRWQVTADTCGPAAALDRFHKDHPREDLPEGLVLGVRLLDDGEVAADPLAALAKDDLAALRARYPSGGGSPAQPADETSTEHGTAEVADHRDGHESGE